jgi:hypothetical protein
VETSGREEARSAGFFFPLPRRRRKAAWREKERGRRMGERDEMTP